MKRFLRVLCLFGWHDSTILNITNVHKSKKLILEGTCTRCDKRVIQIMDMKG